MKFLRIISILLILVLVSGLAAEKAVNFRLENKEGKQVELNDYIGEDFVILDFWASWCGPCKKALPALCKINKTHDDIQVVTVSIDKPRAQKKAKRIVKSRRYSFELLFDSKGDAAKKYNVTNVPRSFIIAPNGEVIYDHSGYQKGDEKHLIEVIEEWKKNNR